MMSNIFRLEKASAKIESLKGSKKAIRIYSPAKFPITSPPKFFTTFDKDFITSNIDFSYNIRNIPSDNVDTKQYADKLQFFHLRNRIQKPEMLSLVFTTKSVNSLITFVNNENIILNETSPKLRSVNQAASKELNNENDSTDFSRFSTLMKSKHDNEHFLYFPNINQAPEIELPKDLPDLPGIVDDISFSFNMSDQELIVPSLAKMNIINELPNVADLIEAETSKKLKEAENKTSSEKQSTEPQNQIVSRDPPSAPAYIPPPPPVPINLIPMPPPVTAAKMPEKQAKQILPESGDDRSSLMQAIRNAGGKSKLRSFAAADELSPVEKKKIQAAPAGDLMSDLHAKLALRRRGIAGTKEAKKEKASLMDKVSSLIPPPPKRTESDNESSDSEWE